MCLRSYTQYRLYAIINEQHRLENIFTRYFMFDRLTFKQLEHLRALKHIKIFAFLAQMHIHNLSLILC